MSAITLPLIHSTAVISGESEPVNIEEVVTFSKVEVTNAVGSTTPTAQIVFVMKSIDTAPNGVIWNFASVAARDAEYVLLLAMVSAPVV